jgi:hypothetical protein
VATAVSGLVATAALSGCSTPAPGAVIAPTPPLTVKVPLSATFATSTGVVAVVAMGTLSNPLNTFWEIFVRPDTTSRWALVTPPGVADNGGLVASPNEGASLLAGFEPSQALAFSPLALSRAEGASWSPGLVPGALAAVPDALAVSSEGGFLALVRADGGEVLRSSGRPTVWSKLVNRPTLASSPAGSSCGIGQITAVSLDAAGGALVATTCTSPGVVGIFQGAGGSWSRVGPRLSGRAGSAPTKVLRLVDLNGVVGALVAAGDESSPSLIGMASTADGTWARSAPLALAPGGRIVSTGVESGGGFVVLASGPNGSMVLHIETGPGGAWKSLPAPPRGTATVAVEPGGIVAALAVASTRFTDWRLDVPTGTWSEVGTITVPIQFGSSS